MPSYFSRKDINLAAYRFQLSSSGVTLFPFFPIPTAESNTIVLCKVAIIIIKTIREP
jgi:hypothetical protein